MRPGTDRGSRGSRRSGGSGGSRGSGGQGGINSGGPDGTIGFRAEFFNLLNRSNFRAPNGNRSANAFGTITQTYDPRQIQLGVKVNF